MGLGNADGFLLLLQMPVCSYYLKGICSNSNCPYSHVYVSRKAEVCQDFLKGYCPMGEKVKRDLSQVLWAKATSSVLHQLWHHREELEAAQHLDVMKNSPVLFQSGLVGEKGKEIKGLRSLTPLSRCFSGKSLHGVLLLSVSELEAPALKTPH